VSAANDSIERRIDPSSIVRGPEIAPFASRRNTRYATFSRERVRATPRPAAGSPLSPNRLCTLPIPPPPPRYNNGSAHLARARELSVERGKRGRRLRSARDVSAIARPVSVNWLPIYSVCPGLAARCCVPAPCLHASDTRSPLIESRERALAVPFNPSRGASSYRRRFVPRKCHRGNATPCVRFEMRAALKPRKRLENEEDQEGGGGEGDNNLLQLGTGASVGVRSARKYYIRGCGCCARMFGYRDGTVGRVN